VRKELTDEYLRTMAIGRLMQRHETARSRVAELSKELDLLAGEFDRRERLDCWNPGSPEVQAEGAA
jgi:hypothetical protein